MTKQAGETMDLDDAIVLVDGVWLQDAAGEDLIVDLSLRLEAESFRRLTSRHGHKREALMDLICGMHLPTTGHVRLFGEDTAKLDRNSRADAALQIGRVFSELRLIDHLSVFDNIALPLRIGGMGRREVRRRTTELLAWLGLADVSRTWAGLATREERRLAAVARAVVGQPPLILADSPFDGLTARSVTTVQFLLEEMARQGSAVLVASHTSGADDPAGERELELDDGRSGTIRRRSGTTISMDPV